VRSRGARLLTHLIIYEDEDGLERPEIRLRFRIERRDYSSAPASAYPEHLYYTSSKEYLKGATRMSVTLYVIGIRRQTS